MTDISILPCIVAIITESRTIKKMLRLCSIQKHGSGSVTYFFKARTGLKARWQLYTILVYKILTSPWFMRTKRNNYCSKTLVSPVSKPASLQLLRIYYDMISDSFLQYKEEETADVYIIQKKGVRRPVFYPILPFDHIYRLLNYACVQLLCGGTILDKVHPLGL